MRRLAGRDAVSALQAHFKRIVFFFLVTALVVQVSACTQRAGFTEFVAYRDAFDASRAASDSLFDLLAVAEQEQQRLAVPRGGAFDPALASIYSDLAEPPLTREYRRAFATISQYNLVMAGLASGETAQTLSAEITALGTESLGLVSALAPSAAAPAALRASLPVFQQIATLALTYRSRAVFANELAANAEPVIAVMAQMRAGSPAIYDYLRAHGSGGAAREDTLRRMVSDWVVLMDRNIAALRASAAAARSGSVAGADVIALRNSVGEVRAAAEAVRKGIAELASR